MHVREAKDFLVDQIGKQASLESIPLSDLERRMLYFTEGKGAVEDPLALNDEFEAQYDTDTYENKISELMTHAYKRVKQEDTVSKQRWDEAIRILKKGDHYILVMWSEPLGVASLRPDSSIVVIAVAVAVVLFFLIFGMRWLTDRMAPPSPRLLFGIFIMGIVLAVVFQRQLGKILDWILDHTVDRSADSKDEEE